MSYDYRPSDAYLIKEMEFKKSLLVEEFQSMGLKKATQIGEHELIGTLDKKVNKNILN